MLLKIILDGAEHQMPLVAANKASLSDLMSLKTESGITLNQIEKLYEEDESDPALIAVGIYLTLRKGGHGRRWADVIELPVSTFDFVREPGDEEPEVEADPTKPAPPASPPDAVPVEDEAA